MGKYDFVVDFIESNKKFEDFTHEELILFKSQVVNLGIDVATHIDKEEFLRIEEVLFEIYNATIDANKENEMEDDTMINEEMAVTEEMTIGEKAKAFAEDAKEKVVDVTKKVASTLSCIEEEAVKISSMNNTKAEAYIAENAVEILEKFKNGATKLLNNIGIMIEESPELETSLRKKAKSLSEFVEIVQDTLDEEDVSGWGKFKAIVKELAKFVLGLILKAAAVVLKIAFTLAVGAIKIGATGLVTVGKVLGVINKEVVKPTAKDIKTVWTNHKARKDDFFDEDDFDEDDFDEDDIEDALFPNA